MDDCIECTVKARDKNGYGKLRRGKKWMLAHRQAWIDAHGPIPEGMLVLHKCDNPPCVNVNHLYLGTNKDNSRDMYDRGRAVPRGKSKQPRREVPK